MAAELLMLLWFHGFNLDAPLVLVIMAAALRLLSWVVGAGMAFIWFTVLAVVLLWVQSWAAAAVPRVLLWFMWVQARGLIL